MFGDLDGDGGDDGVCVDQQRGQVLRLVRRSSPRDPWGIAPIDPDEQAMGAAIADVDRDRLPDVIVGRAWYRHGGDGTWTRHEYTDLTVAGYASFRDSTKVSVRDLDGDGRLDVFATLYAETPVGRVYAFLAPADPTQVPWRAVPVDLGPLFGAHGQAAAGFDGSVRPQILVGETGIGGFDFGLAPHPALHVYRLLGDPADPRAWEHAVIDRIGTHEAQTIDLDDDGLPDVVAHQENTGLVGGNGPVVAWLNRTGR